MDPEWQLAVYNLWQTLALLALSGYWAAQTAIAGANQQR